MSKKAPKNQPDSFEGLEHALTKTEQFIEDNSKVLSYVLFGIIIGVLIFMGIKKYYFKPLESDAAEQMYMAERFFDKDSFDIALDGYGTLPGFAEIADEYKLTKTGKLARYYAGICCLQIGEFDEAIEYLNNFSTDDILVGSTQYSSLGDAYVELGDYDKAVKAYNTAINNYPNDFTTPIILKKAGTVYEEMNQLDDANKAYQKIKKDYPASEEARDVEKYIARTQ